MTNAEKIKELLKSNGNKIFSVSFVKSNGELREMVCRLGVTSHLSTGEQASVAHIDKYLTVFDVQNNGYRNINCESLKSIKMNGVVYSV